MKSVLVGASILSADFLRLGEEVEAAVDGGADFLHLDVMDGHFVPNLSFGPPVIRALKGKTSSWLDVHAMISNPADYVGAYADAGAHRLTVHVEATNHLERLLASIRDHGMQSGVALNPHTPPDFLPYVLDVVDFVLVMTVNPGFSGQKFLTPMLDKIRLVREMVGDRDIRIGVDGGVTPANAGAAVEAGADSLIAATAIYGQDDYGRAIAALRAARG